LKIKKSQTFINTQDRNPLTPIAVEILALRQTETLILVRIFSPQCQIGTKAGIWFIEKAQAICFKIFGMKNC
jgi:hypothetical protein